MSGKHNYITLKKNFLGFDTVYGYDLDVPFAEDTADISYEDTKGLIIESLKPLDEEYSNMLNRAFNENWIEVYPTPANGDGADGTYINYSPHPFVFLNYDGSAASLRNMTYLIGFAAKTKFSSENQSIYNSNDLDLAYGVSASVNEILTLRYMADNAETNEEKLYYLDRLADLYSYSLYDFAMYAEFEKYLYDTAYEGGELNAETLSAKWVSLLKKHYGNSYTAGEHASIGRAVRGDVYYNFNIYTYAVDIAAANYIAEGLLAGKDGYAERYMEFLKSGSTLSVAETLALVGADINTSAIYEGCNKSLNAVVIEMESTMKAEGMIE